MPIPPSSSEARRATSIGVACGTGAALLWAIGFVAARHGISAGFSPSDIVLHRFVWAGLAFVPFLAADTGLRLRAIGAWKSIALTVVGGPPFATLSYAGFLFVPLAHGGVIQPSSAAIGGLVLAHVVLGEKLPAQRILGAAVIIAGLIVIGWEAVASIGGHGVIGDLCFVSAGLLFATFATLLRRWDIAPLRAVAVTSVVSLIDIPVHWLAFGFERMIALGLIENLIQLAAQGLFAGAGATYLFTHSVLLLGAGRAAVFPSLVPGFTLIVGFLLIAELPTAAQIVGFVLVLIGFRLAQKA
jgi:drug/metabolite transporter (DMT)-like permease